MDITTLKNIKVGDRIKFRAICRWYAGPVWRKVVALDPVQVRYGGWPDFRVGDHEILEHEAAANKDWPHGYDHGSFESR